MKTKIKQAFEELVGWCSNHSCVDCPFRNYEEWFDNCPIEAISDYHATSGYDEAMEQIGEDEQGENEIKNIYIAVQVAPEYQNPPLMDLLADQQLDGLILGGNPRVIRYDPKGLLSLIDGHLDIAGHLLCSPVERVKAFGLGDSEGKNLIKKILDAAKFVKLDNTDWSDEELSDWEYILREKAYSSEYRPDLVVDCLNLITGGNWDYAFLSGADSTEWQRCYFDSERYSNKYIRKTIKSQYFNMGKEWFVSANLKAIKNPEIARKEGVSVYTISSNSDDTRQEIANVMKVSPDTVVLLEHLGKVCRDNYKIINA